MPITRLLHAIRPVNDFEHLAASNFLDAVHSTFAFLQVHSCLDSRDAAPLRRLCIGQLAEAPAVANLAGGFFQKIVDVLPGLGL